jgi:hypothetical protein
MGLRAGLMRLGMKNGNGTFCVHDNESSMFVNG